MWPCDQSLVTLEFYHKNPFFEGVLILNRVKNFAKFTGKHLYQSLCFNKVAGLICSMLTIKTPESR